MAEILRTRRPARIDRGERPRRIGGRDDRDDRDDHNGSSGVGVPIIVGDRLWGVLSATSSDKRLPTTVEQRLRQFVDLMAAAVANGEARRQLQDLADEQAALRRVAELAARDARAEEVLAVVAKEASVLAGVEFGMVLRYDENEILGQVEGTSRDSAMGPALVQAQYPTGVGDETATELYVNPTAFYEVFARDLTEAQAGVYGASQRPVAAAAFEEKSGVPDWKTLPSWAVVATGDNSAGADITRSMAQRAGADILEIDGSHVIMISHPQEVTVVILKALQKLS